jgi:hypothetical protein
VASKVRHFLPIQAELTWGGLVGGAGPQGVKKSKDPALVGIIPRAAE